LTVAPPGFEIMRQLSFSYFAASLSNSVASYVCNWTSKNERLSIVSFNKSCEGIHNLVHVSSEALIRPLRCDSGYTPEQQIKIAEAETHHLLRVR